MFKSDLFTFPFNAEVWGTFSDWTMVIVTAVTLTYIVKTFKSQLNVQELQQEINKIEVEKFIQDQDLKFKGEIENPEINSLGDSLIIYTIFVNLHPINGSCKNILINSVFENAKMDYSQPTIPIEKKYIAKNNPIRLKLRGEISKAKFLELEEILSVEIHYQNLLGYQFKQSFSRRFGIANNYGTVRGEPVFIPTLTNQP